MTFFSVKVFYGFEFGPLVSFPLSLNNDTAFQSTLDPSPQFQDSTSFRSPSPGCPRV